jgi:hypothetical protein
LLGLSPSPFFFCLGSQTKKEEQLGAKDDTILAQEVTCREQEKILPKKQDDSILTQEVTRREPIFLKKTKIVFFKKNKKNLKKPR